MCDSGSQAVVYRLFAADGSLLYVGFTAGVTARTSLPRHLGHRDRFQHAYIKIEMFDDPEIARWAEWLTIYLEKPSRNKKSGDLKALTRKKLDMLGMAIDTG